MTQDPTEEPLRGSKTATSSRVARHLHNRLGVERGWRRITNDNSPGITESYDLIRSRYLAKVMEERGLTPSQAENDCNNYYILETPISKPRKREGDPPRVKILKALSPQASVDLETEYAHCQLKREMKSSTTVGRDYFVRRWRCQNVKEKVSLVTQAILEARQMETDRRCTLATDKTPEDVLREVEETYIGVSKTETGRPVFAIRWSAIGDVDERLRQVFPGVTPREVVRKTDSNWSLAR